MKRLFYILFEFISACVILWAVASLLVPEGGMTLGGDDGPSVLIIELTYRLSKWLSVGILAAAVIYITYAVAAKAKKEA